MESSQVMRPGRFFLKWWGGILEILGPFGMDLVEQIWNNDYNRFASFGLLPWYYATRTSF